jgi:hypothetical protein
VVAVADATVVIHVFLQVKTQFQLPKLEAWRVKDTVGVQLDDPASHIVRANFFNAPIKGIPKEIFHYNISIFR